MKAIFEKPTIQLDFSYSNFSQDFCDDNTSLVDSALAELAKIEAGEIVLTGLKILSQASLVLFWAVSSTAF